MKLTQLIKRVVQEKKNSGRLRPLHKLVKQETKIMDVVKLPIELEGYKGKKNSKTLKSIFWGWTTGILTAFASAFVASQPELILAIQALTPVMVDPYVIMIVPAIGTALTSFFARNARKGRIDAVHKIEP